jgi:hypothetical protein
MGNPGEIMPTYEITAPNGKVFEVTAPAGATREQVLAYAKQKFSGGKESQREAAQKDMERMADPTAGMSGVEKFRAGMGKAFTDVGRGVGQLLGQVSRQDVEESRKLDQPLMRSGAGMAGNVLGNVAAAVPTAFIPGANTITGSAAIGAGMGLLQPSASTGETFKNVATGGIAGAAVPALMTAGRVAKSFVEPFYESGRAQIMGRALRQSAGNQADDAMRAMQGAKELVPGSLPTAAEAAGNPGIAAMQRTATAIDPVAMNQLAARQAAQNEARVEVLRNLAGSSGAKEAAVEARDLAAQTAYGKARASDAMRRALEIEQQVNKDAANAGLGSLANLPSRTEAQSAAMAIRPTKALEDLAKRPSFSRFIDDAKRLAADKGQDIGNPLTSIDGLHYIKLAIDDALQPTATSSLGRNAKSSIMDMKNILTKEMDEISPVYGSAREAYQQASKPINQMAIGEELLKSVRPLDQQIMAGQFAKKLSDETAKTATGFKGATLANTLEPDQLQLLNALKQDLARSDFAKTAGRGVGSDTVQKLAFSNMLNAAGVPSAVRSFGPAGAIGNIAQRFGQVAYKDANERMAAELAQALLDPQTAATLMQSGMVTPQMQALVKGLRSGGAALGASVPGLIQANQ